MNEIQLKYGLITDVLRGKGTSVDNYDDLIPTSSEVALAPYVVGVFQDESIRMPKSIEQVIRMIVLQYLGEEDIHHDLIALTYHPQEWTPNLLNMYLKNNGFNRISLVELGKSPDYQKKDIHSLFNIEVLQRVQNLGDEEEMTAHAETIVERLEAVHQEYGLTAIEALAYLEFQRAVRIGTALSSR